MKKTIYFADLTYNTGVLSCDLFPLGCGYVASYAKETYGRECDIKIFRHIDELIEASEAKAPDVLACSCYVWNRNLILHVSGLIKNINPECIVVFGGLAFPLDEKRQTEFLRNNRIIDYLIPYDGELGFSSLMSEYFGSGLSGKRSSGTPINGVRYLTGDQDLVSGGVIKRPKDLNVFPSPYTSGMLDKFFLDKKFTPMIQTTRGCPHTCAYCWAANDYNRNISFFSLDRVNEELEYVASAATKNGIYDLVISDSNFGLYDRDYEIVNSVIKIQEKYKYPRVFSVPCGKRANPEEAKRFLKIKGAKFCFSTQSTDPKILKNIKRKDVSLQTISEYAKAVHSLGRFIATELIAGLPYETRETHLKTLRDLIDCGFDLFDPFTFMLLDGIELNEESSYDKYKYDIRYRLIPRDFGIVKGRHCFETEKVVVGTSTYNFDDYIFFRSLHGLIRLLLNDGIYREMIQYIKQQKVHLLDWILYVFEDLKNGKTQASGCFGRYIQEVHSELWDSQEAIIEYYSKEENYEKLLTRERGDNLMQKYGVLGSSLYFEIYAEYFFNMVHRYLKSRINYDASEGDMEDELNSIKKFTISKLRGVFSDHIEKTISSDVNHDILSWINNGFSEPVSRYRLSSPKKLVAELTDKQLELIKNIFERYNVDRNNPYGLYRVSSSVLVDNYFRKIGWSTSKKNKDDDLSIVNKM